MCLLINDGRGGQNSSKRRTECWQEEEDRTPVRGGVHVDKRRMTELWQEKDRTLARGGGQNTSGSRRTECQQHVSLGLCTICPTVMAVK
jgi:hypothetical protein